MKCYLNKTIHHSLTNLFFINKKWQTSIIYEPFLEIPIFDRRCKIKLEEFL